MYRALMLLHGTDLLEDVWVALIPPKKNRVPLRSEIQRAIVAPDGWRVSGPLHSVGYHVAVFNGGYRYFNADHVGHVSAPGSSRVHNRVGPNAPLVRFNPDDFFQPLNALLEVDFGQGGMFKYLRLRIQSVGVTPIE